MLTEKANAICLLKIFEEYSDENHILPMREIRGKLDSIYGMSTDRRTVYGAVALLIDLGYDISTYEENGSGYYLKQRVFEPGEVRLLMDAVYSFPFLPAKHTADLISKLQQLCSVHARKKLKHLSVVRQEHKTPNRQVFWNIEQLDDAISAKKKIRFDYLQYNVAKELVSRRSEKYTVNPYGMVFSNEHYYLICCMEGRENVSLYRIDRIRDIELTNEKLEKREPGFDPQKFIKESTYAFVGQPEPVTFRCERHILDHVIDRFGTDIHIRKIDEEVLEIRIFTALGGVKFWALQFLPYVEIISPQSLRDDIIESLRGNKYLKAL